MPAFLFFFASLNKQNQPTLKAICVFCGSATVKNATYIKMARMLGRYLAENNLKLVYGAGNIGLMGQLADACLEAGGQVLGVIPNFLKEKEVCHTGLTELIVTDTMHQRKEIMEKQSDAFIVLPGGFGTLDEFFEILTWKQLGLHHKPIAIYNPDGYYNHLLRHISHMNDQGFFRQPIEDLLIVETEMLTLLRKLVRRAAGNSQAFDNDV